MNTNKNIESLTRIIEGLTLIRNDFDILNKSDLICSLGGNESLLRMLIDRLQISN